MSPLAWRTKTVAGSCSTGPLWVTVGIRLDLITGNTVVFWEIISLYSPGRLHGGRQRRYPLAKCLFQLCLYINCYTISPHGNEWFHHVISSLSIKLSQFVFLKKTSASSPDRFDIWLQSPSWLIGDTSDQGSESGLGRKAGEGERDRGKARLETGWNSLLFYSKFDMYRKKWLHTFLNRSCKSFLKKKTQQQQTQQLHISI